MSVWNVPLGKQEWESIKNNTDYEVGENRWSRVLELANIISDPLGKPAPKPPTEKQKKAIREVINGIKTGAWQ